MRQLSIKQVLRNKYYGNCRTRVADKRDMYRKIYYLTDGVILYAKRSSI